VGSFGKFWEVRVVAVGARGGGDRAGGQEISVRQRT
jgi:hypothetical protein